MKIMIKEEILLLEKAMGMLWRIEISLELNKKWIHLRVVTGLYYFSKMRQE